MYKLRCFFVAAALVIGAPRQPASRPAVPAGNRRL